MYELMFRRDLLESSRLGLREVSLPLFRMVTALVADAQPPAGGAAPEVVAVALPANLRGIAQLWGWGSLQFSTGLTDPGPRVQSALDAHLGPACQQRELLTPEGTDRACRHRVVSPVRGLSARPECCFATYLDDEFVAG
jgi:hypothetical protein